MALNGDDLSAEGVLAAFDRICDPEGQEIMENAFSQPRKHANLAAAARGLPLPSTE